MVAIRTGKGVPGMVAYVGLCQTLSPGPREASTSDCCDRCGHMVWVRNQQAMEAMQVHLAGGAILCTCCGNAEMKAAGVDLGLE